MSESRNGRCRHPQPPRSPGRFLRELDQQRAVLPLPDRPADINSAVRRRETPAVKADFLLDSFGGGHAKHDQARVEADFRKDSCCCAGHGWILWLTGLEG